jgi:anti-sigma factor RsiW
MPTTARSLTCRELVDFLMAYLDDELSHAESTAFEAHLAVCEDCVRYLQSYQATLRLERLGWETPDAAAPSEVPPELVAAILASRFTH